MDAQRVESPAPTTSRPRPRWWPGLASSAASGFRTREGARLLAALATSELVTPEEWLPTAYFSLSHQLAPTASWPVPSTRRGQPVPPLRLVAVASGARSRTPELVSSRAQTGPCGAATGELLLGVQAAWSEGRLAPAVALGATVFVERREPGSADLLELQGSLYEALGDDAEAQARPVGQSTRPARTRDRSHEGLDVLWVRRRAVRNFADAPASVERARLEVERTAFPPEEN